jgi:hypothetical protein
MMPIQMASRSFSPDHFDKRTSKTAAMAPLTTWPNGALVLTVACVLVSRFTVPEQGHSGYSSRVIELGAR